MLFSYLQQLLLPLGRQEHFVHPVESFFEGAFVVTLLVHLRLYQLLNEVIFHIDGDFLAAMTIKNRENCVPICESGVCDMSVLLLLAPALHAASSPAECGVLACLGLFFSYWSA